jgi:hypothetical protein
MILVVEVRDVLMNRRGVVSVNEYRYIRLMMTNHDVYGQVIIKQRREQIR